MVLRRIQRAASYLVVVTAVVAALATVLAGCSGDTEEPAEPTAGRP